MKLFFIGFMIIFLLLWWLSRQGFKFFFISPLNRSRVWIYVYDMLYLGTGVFSVLYRLGGINETRFTYYTLRVHYVVMGLSWLLALFYFITKLLGKIRKNKDHNTSESRRVFMTRTAPLLGAGTISAATAIGAYQSNKPELEKVQIPLEPEFKKLSGLKIVQLSDIHIGPNLKKEFFDSLVDRTNALKPDLVVITGDLVDGLVENIGKEMKRMNEFQSRLGTFYVTGNHEYYWDGQSWIDFMSSKGFEVLGNKHKVLNYNGEDFVLAGVHDLKADRFVKEHKCDPKRAIEGAPKNTYKILLAHQPLSCKLAEGLGYNLQLSGHTHGGQGHPWSLLVKIVQPYLRGLYEHKGMKLYVNRGTGYWGPPYRLGIPGEITQITLV